MLKKFKRNSKENSRISIRVHVNVNGNILSIGDRNWERVILIVLVEISKEEIKERYFFDK